MADDGNPMAAAMDEQEQAQRRDGGDIDLEPYYEEMADAPKNETIGFAASEVMHAFYRQLQQDDSVDVNAADGFRNHLENLAHRHPEVFERAMRKLEIDREG